MVAGNPPATGETAMQRKPQRERSPWEQASQTQEQAQCEQPELHQPPAFSPRPLPPQRFEAPVPRVKIWHEGAD